MSQTVRVRSSRAMCRRCSRIPRCSLLRQAPPVRKSRFELSTIIRSKQFANEEHQDAKNVLPLLASS
ncbi:uncharacterized protein PHALS_15302 [Plasmopara halstedii]|uniref:Uncharacterized protein n=1 Tax=Plasmopara halstedii TaxID=4781 RepID=A0A0P1ABU3_PLAHL|nr:uncharacterized protein PHALS_15302 [Plasmopara halstedii]CEG38343.1 hypothetical protein PHALS_15302 [Plasmopara halstedii]|eukprot:XP_024574712.1 hypothetical protein PHALS_15302 [Plasmopara halstedii]